MTTCLKDTASVTWVIDTGAVEAAVQVSKDSDNAITVSAAGLLADFARRDLFRFRSTATVAIATGAQNTGALALSQSFVSPAGMTSLTPFTTGLYHLTAFASWASSAAGSYRSLVAVVGAVQYPDVIYNSASASSFSSNQFINSFDGIVQINAGQTVTMTFQQDTGGALNALGNNERVGIELMANLIMET